MRKIVIGMNAGFAGTDAWEFWLIPATVSADELNQFAWECAKNNAEMYGIYPREEYEDGEGFDEDDESYSDDIESWWETYDPDKHDGHTTTGTPEWQKYYG